VLDGFANAPRVPELRKRLLFTASAMAVYRLGVWIPTPGIDGQALSDYFQQIQGIVDLVNVFSGGALERFSIFALGIMPYISSSIILQLLTVVIPHLERLSKEGELGRRKITQYTRYGTVRLALMQGLFISIGLESIEAPGGGGGVVYEPGWSFRLMAMVTLTTGTAFLMWLGEQVTERGIGNGISLIIFAGIVAQLPSAIVQTLEFVRLGEMSIFAAIFIGVLAVTTVGAVIFIERGQRRIPIQHAKRTVGRKVYASQSTHLPLKVNTAGVIPPIFASSLLLFPATIAGFMPDNPIAATINEYLDFGSVLYNLTYVGLIIFFCYFYTAVTFNPVDVAENLKKVGAYIPGIRPGQRTADYIDRVLTRITLPGAIYVSIVCVLPTILITQFRGVSFFFGGTALLIVVGVALDTISQIETHLISRSYEGFMKRGRIRGRRS
jgi:preprotein translocase subunit SecY